MVKIFLNNPGRSFYSIIAYKLREERGAIQSIKTREKTLSYSEINGEKTANGKREANKTAIFCEAGERKMRS